MGLKHYRALGKSVLCVWNQHWAQLSILLKTCHMTAVQFTHHAIPNAVSKTVPTAIDSFLVWKSLVSTFEHFEHCKLVSHPTRDCPLRLSTWKLSMRLGQCCDIKFITGSRYSAGRPTTLPYIPASWLQLYSINFNYFKPCISLQRVLWTISPNVSGVYYRMVLLNIF